MRVLVAKSRGLLLVFACLGGDACFWQEACGYFVTGDGPVSCTDENSLAIRPSEARLVVGERLPLRAIFTRTISGMSRESPPDRGVTWFVPVSLSSIATVTNGGVVIALSPGTVAITGAVGRVGMPAATASTVITVVSGDGGGEGGLTDASLEQ